MPYGRFGGDGPTSNAAGFVPDALNAGQHFAKVLQVREEIPDRPQRGIHFNFAFE